jgi:serine phosphatase RsbU (regulator of sigma subunit)
VSGSLELEEVYDRVARHAAAVTGGSRALLSRINARTGEPRAEAHVDFSDELSYRALVLGGGSFAQVARNRTPLLHRRSEAEGADLALMRELRIGSLMHAPIELGPRLHGVLTVAHEEDDRFAPEDLELLVRLARSSAAAIANAIDFGRERRIARALTAGFVPESLPGFETGLVYEPAASQPTGGDVYGAWRIGSTGEMAVLVGDVAGKGVETAALSAMARFFIEARSHDSSSPAEVLEQANRMLTGRLPSNSFVTAFLAIVSGDSLRYANAGHLPPLVVSGGRASALASHGLPLGIEDGARYGESELRLQSGDLVFAYSDGLVETRRGGEGYGSARLADLVARLARSLTPQELVRAVHDEVAGWADGLTDDAVALALRRCG